MPISFALSNTAFPALTLEELVVEAKTLGFASVELRTTEGRGGLAADPVLSKPADVAKLFADEKISFACLSTELSLHRFDTQSRKDSKEKFQRFVDLAAATNARAVRILTSEWSLGWSKLAMLHGLAEQGYDLARIAGERNVQLLFENIGPITGAKDWWDVINQIDNPSAGILWNAAHSAIAGESPAVSIPTLNSRIRLVRLMDYQLSPSPAVAPLGQGQLQLEHIIKRLMGIGYNGALLLDYDCSGSPSASQNKNASEEFLKNAMTKVKEIFTSLAPPAPKPKAAPAAKPAAAAKPAEAKAAAPAAEAKAAVAVVDAKPAATPENKA